MNNDATQPREQAGIDLDKLIAKLEVIAQVVDGENLPNTANALRGIAADLTPQSTPEAQKAVAIVTGSSVQWLERAGKLADRSPLYASPVAAPEAPTSEQQALRNGYQGSTMVSDFQGPKITLRHATSAQADAAHEVLCKMIDATPAATTASASDGSIYESVSRRADPVGHAEAMAQLDEVLGRATAPSRNAAPLTDIRAIAAKYGHEIGEVCATEIRAALTQQSAAQAPVCQGEAWSELVRDLYNSEKGRHFAARLERLIDAAQASHAGADTERDAWQPIETAPHDEVLLLAYEFDRPGDWRIKVGGYWNGGWEVFGASWTPTRWKPLPNAPIASDYKSRRAAMSAATEQKEKP